MGRAAFGRFGERTVQPAFGFAQYMTPDRRPVASQPEYHDRQAAVQPWPGIVVGRKVDKSRAGSRWKKFPEILDAQSGRHSTATPFARLMCRYVEVAEMNDIMTELYPGPSRDMANKRRNRLATEMRSTINGIVREMSISQHQGEMSLSTESVYLEKRIHNPDDYDLELLDCHAVKVADRGFWRPGSFAIDGPDGYGVYGIGLKLNDDNGDIRQEREMLVGGMRRKLGFDPTLVSADWYPKVQVLDTYPLPAPELGRFRLPSNCPYILPVQEPHAYPAA